MACQTQFRIEQMECGWYRGVSWRRDGTKWFFTWNPEYRGAFYYAWAMGLRPTEDTVRPDDETGAGDD
jgi:hypothetical protein